MTTFDVARRVGPLLADGTPLSDLFDLDNREWSTRLLHDPEVYRLELERIFARTWVVLGHETEIPNPGDFVLRTIGEDQVIVTRDEQGQINALLNVCTHRSMQVCRADDGNQSTFKCPFHGWAFGSDGRMLGAPFEKEMYGELDKSRLGLERARVALRHGLIFATFGKDAPSLDDYLGDLNYYIDHIFGDSEWEVAREYSRQPLEANWKLDADQNNGDTYHGYTLHASIMEMQKAFSEKQRDSDSQADYDSAFEYRLDEAAPVILREIVKLTLPPTGHVVTAFPGSEMLADESAPDPSANGKTYKIKGRSVGCHVFPSTLLVSFNSRLSDGTFGTHIVCTGLVPVGPGKHESWTIVLVEKTASEEARAVMRMHDTMGYGIGVPDDYETWPNIQRSSRGVVSQRVSAKYNARAEPNTESGWTGPGVVYAGNLGGLKEETQWSWWQRYFELMTAAEGEA